MDKARIKAPERPLNKHPNHFEYRNIITEMHPKPVILGKKRVPTERRASSMPTEKKQTVQAVLVTGARPHILVVPRSCAGC